MKKHLASLVVIVVVGMLGCAKQDMVKKDEQVVPAVTASSTLPHQTENADEKQAKTQVLKESPDVKGPQAQGELEPVSRTGELKAVLENIYFNFDSYVLSKEARETLARNAEAIKLDTGYKLRIEGHCDERGSDEYNLALGERRGRAAMQYLLTMGISAERLSMISYGEEKPVDPGHNEAAWAKARRNEFVFTQ